MRDTTGPRGDASVDQLLLGVGLDGDAELRPVLLELRALGSVAPQPSAEVLALMAGTSGAITSGAITGHDPAAGRAAATAAVPAVEPLAAPVDEVAARRRAKRRVAFTALSVALSLSAGGAVAAASDQDIRRSFTRVNEAITSFITGSLGTPANDQAEKPAEPSPATPAGMVPASAAPTGPASIPADPAAGTQTTTVPPSGGPAAESSPTRQRTSPVKPGEVPASGTVPGAVPGHTAEGLGGPPDVPVPSQVPLPATLPAVPLP